MQPAFAGADVFLRAIGEEQRADLVVVADRAEGEHGGEFRGEFAFALADRAGAAAGAGIDEDHHRHLALLDVLLDVRHAGARSHVPVDAPHFIARLVFAHFVEIHAAPLEDRMVLAGHEILDEPHGAQLDLPDLFQPLAWNHGTATVSKMCATIFSLVTSSASASNVVMTRCRSTSSAMLFTSCGVT